MPRQKVTDAQIEERLQGLDDPARRLPAHFPTMHSRIRPTQSEFVVAVVEEVKAEGGFDLTPDPEDEARRAANRKRWAAAAAARKR